MQIPPTGLILALLADENEIAGLWLCIPDLTTCLGRACYDLGKSRTALFRRCIWWSLPKPPSKRVPSIVMGRSPN